MAVQTIVSTGATDYTIQNQFSGQPIIMTVDNVTQVETVDFTRYGTILTFTSPPAPGLVIAIQDVAGVTGSPLSSFIAVDGGTVIGGGGPCRRTRSITRGATRRICSRWTRRCGLG